MLLKQILEAYDVLDNSTVTGNDVANYLKSIKPDADIEVYELVGPKGSTDMLKVRIPGTNGKSKGGNAPTLGILGRLGGIGARPEMIGFVSQLTHCIAVCLMTCKDNEHLVDYTGDSFRYLTRIAKINEDMWCELFLLNKEELLSQMDLFIDKFKELKSAIEVSDTEKIKGIMRTSTARRRHFDKK